ncbi:site-specific integrase [Paracraurococcus ruber]|uniref:Tyr recombinase domain-containing protein n=1 Tax=Paracraurococcus ruber TaxID=77675 RepID=A0ABS1CU44_9PROT|nr:site-specific integrase [Paracraurococcus ruber]MBK1657796.1 hypothetical protein [Paracraurococcus ruber]TDG26855.1 site-specific integrase [Paracraurococcus ruber]
MRQAVVTAVDPPSAIVPLDPVHARARGYASRATAAATRKAYQGDWDCFAAWTTAHGLDLLPAQPETDGAYLAAKADSLRVSTLERRLAAIATAHRLAGHQLDTRHPAIREVMRGIRRQHGSAQRQAAAATVEVVRAMVATCDDALLGLRDRALLLLGFAGAFRRSELVALQVADLAEEESGLRVTIRRSKGDQEGAGQLVGIARTGSATCPVAALAAWRNAAAIADGPLFRSVDRHGRIGDSLSDKAVALIVKRCAAAAGLDPAGFSGHSLRAGLATSAAAHGLEERDIQRQTRHRSATVLRRYIRDGGLFRANVSGRVGL